MILYTCGDVRWCPEWIARGEVGWERVSCCLRSPPINPNLRVQHNQAFVSMAGRGVHSRPSQAMGKQPCPGWCHYGFSRKSKRCHPLRHFFFISTHLSFSLRSTSCLSPDLFNSQSRIESSGNVQQLRLPRFHPLRVCLLSDPSLILLEVSSGKDNEQGQQLYAFQGYPAHSPGPHAAKHISECCPTQNYKLT